MPPKKVPAKTKVSGGDVIENMTVVQLRKLAKARGVSLVGLTKKVDIIHALSSNGKPKKAPTKKKSIPKNMWAVLQVFRPGKGARIFGVYPGREEALYAIYLDEEEDLQDMIKHLRAEGYINGPDSYYHLIEVDDISAYTSHRPNHLSWAAFKKRVKELEDA